MSVDGDLTTLSFQPFSMFRSDCTKEDFFEMEPNSYSTLKFHALTPGSTCLEKKRTAFEVIYKGIKIATDPITVYDFRYMASSLSVLLIDL